MNGSSRTFLRFGSTMDGNLGARSWQSLLPVFPSLPTIVASALGLPRWLHSFSTRTKEGSVRRNQPNRPTLEEKLDESLHCVCAGRSFSTTGSHAVLVALALPSHQEWSFMWTTSLRGVSAGSPFLRIFRPFARAVTWGNPMSRANPALQRTRQQRRAAELSR